MHVFLSMLQVCFISHVSSSLSDILDSYALWKKRQNSPTRITQTQLDIEWSGAEAWGCNLGGSDSNDKDLDLATVDSGFCDVLALKVCPLSNHL